jgi:hypothetical protein
MVVGGLHEPILQLPAFSSEHLPEKKDVPGSNLSEVQPKQIR